MRILFLASYFPRPTNVTMGTWALEQAQAFRRAGMEVRVRSYNSWFPKFLSFHRGIRAYAMCPASHEWDGLRVDYPRWPLYPFNAFNRPMHRWPVPQLKMAWGFIGAGLLRAVEEYRPDAVFAHHTAPNGFLAMKIHQRYGIPFVVTDHTYEDVEDALVYPNRRRLYQAVCARASAMVGISKRMTRGHEKLCAIVGAEAGAGEGGRRAVTIFNGGDAPVSPTVEARLAELEGKIVITSVGILYERKGVPLLIRAFGRVAERHPAAVLRIVGDGHDRGKAEAAIEACGLRGRVTMCGMLPRERVRQELAWCDVFALVGWDEPWGVVYNEAMAAGKPILCANDGGINDVLVNGETAVTVPPRDEEATAVALERLIGDPGLRERIGKAGHELFVKRLTWDANAGEFAGVFERAVEGIKLQGR